MVYTYTMGDVFRFGAKDFCQLTGISPETLRHYVDCGVLTSFKIDGNNYRKFSVQNMLDVFHARICRGLGLPIQSIIQKSESGLEEQESVLTRHRASLEREALQLRMKLNRIQQEIEFLASARGRLGQVQERSAEHAPSIYRIPLVDKNHKISRELETIRRIGEWMEHPQYLHVAINAPKEALLEPRTDRLPVSLSIGVREEYARKLGLNTSPPVEYFPRMRHLGTMIATRDPLGLRRSDICPLLDRAAELGLHVANDLIGRLCYVMDTDTGRLYYFSANICVR